MELPADPGRDALLHEEVRGANVTCVADPFRLRQLFRNLFDNALDACKDPVRLTVTCAEAVLEGRPITIAGTGVASRSDA